MHFNMLCLGKYSKTVNSRTLEASRAKITFAYQNDIINNYINDILSSVIGMYRYTYI